LNTRTVMRVGAAGFNQIHAADGAGARMILQDLRVHRAYPKLLRRLSLIEAVEAVLRMGGLDEGAGVAVGLLPGVIAYADRAGNYGQRQARME